MFINKVTLYGNLTKDPELKSLPNGTHVSQFSIATNRTIKDSAGAKRDIPEFHNIVSFGKTAELIHMYLKKGNPIYIEGRIQTRSWDGQDGKKLYRTEIVIEQFQFGPKPKEGYVKEESQEQTDDVYGPEFAGHLAQDNNQEINPEDIPF